MARRPKDRKRKDWYSISLETLRNAGTLLVVAAVLGVSVHYYRVWEERALAHEATKVIEDARNLFDRVRSIATRSQAGELETARQSLATADAHLRERHYHDAVQAARYCRSLLQTLLDASASGAPGAARFISLQGEVEYRRGESGDWLEAKNRVALKPGDYVRTSDGGSAEIMFANGTFYTVRPKTQVIVSTGLGRSGEEEQSIRMDYGWVDLSTRQRPSQVVTPGSQARIRAQSDAFVTYDRDAREGRIGALRGSIEVTSPTGLRQVVGNLQQVVQKGDQLSAPARLLDPPKLATPNDNLELELERTRTLALRWEPVPGAASYALEVGRNHLFVNNVIADSGRRKTTATLGLRGEGSFLWRVAAVDGAKTQGPWSEPRKFRVASIRIASPNGERDTKPPALDLDDIKPYGTILIVGGKTEPGARLSINGEAVEVDPNGAFNKAIQITKEGWSTVEIRAADAQGNPTVVKRSVFIEGS
ncbi:MAG TPA: FecR domain-containing protein [Thermoanaerobaculia bacterium]|nr:FecR domain-containing protein [Thermoanaerobaculia bacterium]